MHCILVGLGLHLESHLEMHPNSKYLFTSQVDAQAPEKLKNKHCRDLKNHVWTMQEFIHMCQMMVKRGTSGSTAKERCLMCILSTAVALEIGLRFVEDGRAGGVPKLWFVILM